MELQKMRTEVNEMIEFLHYGGILTNDQTYEALTLEFLSFFHTIFDEEYINETPSFFMTRMKYKGSTEMLINLLGCYPEGKMKFKYGFHIGKMRNTDGICWLESLNMSLNNKPPRLRMIPFDIFLENFSGSLLFEGT